MISVLKDKYSEGLDTNNENTVQNILSLSESLNGDDYLKLRCEIQLIDLTNELLKIEELVNSKRYRNAQNGLNKLVWVKIFESSAFSSNYNEKNSKYEEELATKFINFKTRINSQLPKDYRVEIDNPFDGFWN